LRPLWTEFPAEAVGVFTLQECSYTLLVSVDEHGDATARVGVQRGGGTDYAAAFGGRAARAVRVSSVVVVRPAGGCVWMGAAGDGAAGVGLLRVERGASQAEGMVHAKAADVLAGSGSGADDSMVDSRGATARAISLDDRKVSRHAGDVGVGGRAGGGGVAVHRRGVAGLSAGPRENAERGVRGAAGGGAGHDGGWVDDDDAGMKD
jgi:hypothetical protein